MAANEEVTGERAMTFTRSQLDEAVRKAVDEAIARMKSEKNKEREETTTTTTTMKESEKTKEKEDTKSITINNNYTCYGLCYNRVDLSETKKSKGKNIFSKDLLAENNFYQLHIGKFMTKLHEMLRKIFNLRPPFPKD